MSHSITIALGFVARIQQPWMSPLNSFKYLYAQLVLFFVLSMVLCAGMFGIDGIFNVLRNTLDRWRKLTLRVFVNLYRFLDHLSCFTLPKTTLCKPSWDAWYKSSFLLFTGTHEYCLRHWVWRECDSKHQTSVEHFGKSSLAASSLMPCELYGDKRFIIIEVLQR